MKEREDGSLLVEGLKDAHKMLKDFWNTVNNRQKVSCNILTDSMVNIEKCEGKDVIVIRVPRAERTTKPVYVGCDPRSGSYRSNGDARWTDRITCHTGDWGGNVFDFLLKFIPKLQSDLKVPLVFNGNLRDENTPVHKAIREAMINMVTNADFHGRRGVVVNKDDGPRAIL
ncbi:MAG: hypothetical protein NC098_09185 [Lachnoclostridium sp.]|nr:hypothetical protein [Lachnoclostridium sp.]